MARVRRLSSDAPSTPEPRAEVRVVVAADHALVAESVRAALAGRGFSTVVVRRRTDEHPPGWVRRSPGHSRHRGPEVGILLTHSAEDQSPWAQVILERMSIPWLVLAPEERGPTWGAFYASNATLVVPTTASLDEVCGLLDDLAVGRGPSAPRGRRELIRAWRRSIRERDELADRLGSLTVREQQVLRQLHDGVGVRVIAEDSKVSEATVRTQVKAILKKLEVSSQIAAVAAYEELLVESTRWESISRSESLSAK